MPDFTKTPQVNHIIETKGRPVKAASRPIRAPGTPKYEKGKKAWDALEKMGVIKRLEPEETVLSLLLSWLWSYVSSLPNSPRAIVSNYIIHT